MSSYREKQQKLKVDKSLGRIEKTFKLNQKGAVLASKIQKVSKKIMTEKKKIDKQIKNVPKDGTITNISINKYVSIKQVIEKMIQTATHIPVIKFTFENSVKYYTLSNVNRQRLLATFGQDDNEIFQNVLVPAGASGSDEEFTHHMTGKVVDNVDVYYMSKSDKKKKDGAFFPYTHNLDLDLSRYQIYNIDETDNYKHNCFIHCLIQWGQLENKEIEYVKTFCKNDNIAQKDFKIISEKLNIGIIVKRPETSRNHIISVKFNANVDKIITIGLICNHYFIIEEVPITSYAIINYDKIKNIKDWHRIFNSANKKSDRFISSYEVVRLLLENKEQRLTEIVSTGPIMGCSSYVHIDKVITTLEYLNANCRLVEFKDKSLEKNAFDSNNNIVYFDFETTTDTDEHQPFLCSSIDKNDNIKTFKGLDCGLNFLLSLKTDTTIIIHNLGYDFRFLIKYLKNITLVQKSQTNIMSANALFINKNLKIKLSFKCSYAMIGCSLGEFAKMFNLIDVKKEIMPYGAYTRESVAKEKINIETAKNMLKLDQQEDFIKNIKDWNLQDGDDFYHIQYSKIYCESDVKTTKKGYEQFRIWMLEITGLDILNYPTLASVADAYLKKDGCYSECYEFSGIIQQFLQQFVVGGRTMINNNTKTHVVGKFSDFDAVSLYPSAMKRMSGFLKGKPNILRELHYDFLQKQDGYFVEIDVTRVGIKRNFSILNKMTDEGVRLFDSSLLGLHKVDKTTLEDLIEFQDIDFKIIRGYYFNEGHNTKINKTIEYLFNQRLAMKKIKNPIQAVYKLLMNSSYGKSILKPIDTERKIIETDRFDVYMQENYNSIIEACVISNTGKTSIKSIKPINDHFNCGHIGTEILSMSKRIMNEVMCLAEDRDYMIYYQDTDSMHIDYNSVPKLAADYKLKYGKNLIGEGLGQFHSDFAGKSDTEIYAVESIFLGKKCYIDKLRLSNNGIETFEYHIRMKGVPNEIVNLTANKLYGDVMAMYKHMFTGESVVFDLLAGMKKFFVGSSDYSIRNRENLSEANGFTRELKF